MKGIKLKIKERENITGQVKNCNRNKTELQQN